MGVKIVQITEKEFQRIDTWLWTCRQQQKGKTYVCAWSMSHDHGTKKRRHEDKDCEGCSDIAKKLYQQSREQ